MADTGGPPVLPREAIAFLRAKERKPSKHWLEVWRTEHANAFTVAQMTKMDLLAQTHRGLLRAMRRGETLETFRGRLQPFLEAKGWAPGRGGNIPKRLERIYLTNLRAAAAAGHWDRIQRRKEVMPWLIYELGPSLKHREDHASWAGTCLRVDDPWWQTHYPPNGWGCKCTVTQVAKPPAGARTEAPPDEMRPWKNPHTKEVIEVPKGIDPGWDFNAAEHAVAGMANALTVRLKRLVAPGGVEGRAGGRVGPRRQARAGARRAAVTRLVRGVIERYVTGPGFARFVERDRPPPVRRRGQRRVQQRRAQKRPVRQRIDYGLADKAAPVALLTAARQKTLEVHTPVVVLTDWGAGKGFWRHGIGLQGKQRARRRRFEVEVPAARYVEIQAIVDDVDDVTLVHQSDGRWLFAHRDGRRLVLMTEAGVAQVLTFFRARGEPRVRKPRRKD